MPQPTPPNQITVFFQPNLSPTIPKIRLNTMFPRKIVPQICSHTLVEIPCWSHVHRQKTGKPYVPMLLMILMIPPVSTRGFVNRIVTPFKSSSAVSDLFLFFFSKRSLLINNAKNAPRHTQKIEPKAYSNNRTLWSRSLSTKRRTQTCRGNMQSKTSRQQCSVCFAVFCKWPMSRKNKQKAGNLTLYEVSHIHHWQVQLFKSKYDKSSCTDHIKQQPHKHRSFCAKCFETYTRKPGSYGKRNSVYTKNGSGLLNGEPVFDQKGLSQPCSRPSPIINKTTPKNPQASRFGIPILSNISVSSLDAIIHYRITLLKLKIKWFLKTAEIPS